MNGLPAQVYLWLLAVAATLIAAGAGIIGALLSFAVHLHIKADDEFKQRMEKVLEELGQRVHRYKNEVSRIGTRQRWDDEDRAKKED